MKKSIAYQDHAEIRQETKNIKSLIVGLLVTALILSGMQTVFLLLFAFNALSVPDACFFGCMILHLLSYGIVLLCVKRPAALFRACFVLWFSLGGLMLYGWLHISWWDYTLHDVPLFTWLHAAFLLAFSCMLIGFWHYRKRAKPSRKKKKTSLPWFFTIPVFFVIITLSLLKSFQSSHPEAFGPVHVYVNNTFGPGLMFFFAAFSIIFGGTAVFWTSREKAAKLAALEQSTLLQDETTLDASSKND